MPDSFAYLPTEILVGFAFLLGLIVGSFLNVVIYRYPIKLKYEWSKQSYEWLNDRPYTEASPPGIIKPASHCQNCKQAVRAWQNIPLISYLLLRGKCANCQTPIGIRYPLVELLTGVMSALIVLKLGWSLATLFALIFTWVIITLTFIDFDHQLLPDTLVLPTLWLGLLINTQELYTNVQSAVIGAAAGYLSLWLVFHLFKIATGKEGMGFGDFKLLAMIGAWLGWQILPLTLLLSTVLGTIIGVTLIITGKLQRDKPIPFGPYLALAGWVALLWGTQINQWYLSASGL